MVNCLELHQNRFSRKLQILCENSCFSFVFHVAFENYWEMFTFEKVVDILTNILGDVSVA